MSSSAKANLTTLIKETNVLLSSEEAAELADSIMRAGWRPPLEGTAESYSKCPDCGHTSVTYADWGGGVRCVQADCDYWFCF